MLACFCGRNDLGEFFSKKVKGLGLLGESAIPNVHTRDAASDDVVQTFIDNVVAYAELRHHRGGGPSQIVRGPASAGEHQRFGVNRAILHALLRRSLTVAQLLAKAFDAHWTK